ncbi:glycosyl hydrolase family 28-related protein [Puia sp. P3]|uniref:glycosyl hydrolase family 28-related protein n=1 Tax=Puia sp. P3 TaxID=3423952 RepID=UPI003D66EAF4
MTAKNTPIVIDIDSNYCEKLFMEDCRFDGVRGPAIRISNEENASVQINLRHVVCRNVPVLTANIANGRQVQGPTSIYEARSLTAGLQIDDWSADPTYSTTKDLQPLNSFPAASTSDIPAFPSMDTWANLLQLGAKGDGETDDTKAIQDAIDKYPVIYVPQGWYRISNTLRLKPNTVIIGLNPVATQLQLADNTQAFGGFGSPVPLLETSRGGNNIVSGIGLSTGASNPRAVGCKWMAGGGSYLNDVKFIGGHGGLNRPGTPRTTIYQQQDKDWDSQYWSLWITDGGGGTFKDIWSASTYCTSGAYISNTSTPGRIYAMSVEHHVRNEIRFNKVSNWKVYALQLEEESRESSECQPMEIQDCHNMTFANLYMFRVIRVIKPYPYSVRLWGCSAMEFLNVHNFSQIKYTTTSALYDVNSNTEVRPWEFARLMIPAGTPTNPPTPGAPAAAASSPAGSSPSSPASSSRRAPSPTAAATSTSASPGCAASTAGRRPPEASPSSPTIPGSRCHSPATRKTTCSSSSSTFQNKAGWSMAARKLFQSPDAAGTSFSGWGNSGFATWVYSIDPGNPDETITLLPRSPMGTVAHPFKVLYPAHRWRDFHDFNTVIVNRPGWCYVAPDGATVIPDVYDLARSTALTAAYPGQPFYATDEYDKRTVRLSVSPEGYLSGLTHFAERGEFVSIPDKAGNVYIADGQLYRYDPQGRQHLLIRTPERPTGMTLSPDQKMMYVTGHHGFYEVALP